MARPPRADTASNKMIGIRLTEDEHAQLLELADAAGLDVSALVRSWIARGGPRTRAPRAPAPSAEPAQPVRGDASPRILRALTVLSARHQFDGLVPLPELRRESKLDRSTFDAVLIEMEQRRIVELKIANNPRAVKDSTDGIRIQGRGLVYYAALP